MMANYELTRHCLRACRALAKLIAIETIPDWVWVSETAFDGGEWSGPALAKVQQQIETKCCATVAIRFGYMPNQLSESFNYYQFTEQCMWWDSLPSLGCYK